jgi:hypothetical protein
MQQGYLWLLTYAMFLVGLALFIPSAFSSAWVKIPFSANISSDDASGDVADMMAGLWTDCNVTTHICDDYNTGRYCFYMSHLLNNTANFFYTPYLLRGYCCKLNMLLSNYWTDLCNYRPIFESF